MKLGDLLNSGINFEGWFKMQCWEDECNPEIYYEGYGMGQIGLREYLDREVAYIFPYHTGSTPAICIELAEEVGK